jgi:hypothetical protein
MPQKTRRRALPDVQAPSKTRNHIPQTKKRKTAAKVVIYGSGEKPEEIDLDVKGARVWGHRQFDEHFIECVINKKKPQVTAEDGIIATEISKKMVKECLFKTGLGTL